MLFLLEKYYDFQIKFYFHKKLLIKMLHQNILRFLIAIFSLIQYNGYAQNNLKKALLGKKINTLTTR